MEKVKKIAVVALVLITAFTIYSLLQWKRRQDDDEATFQAIYAKILQHDPNGGWVLNHVDDIVNGQTQLRANWLHNGKVLKSAALMSVTSDGYWNNQPMIDDIYAIWNAYSDRLHAQNIL